MEISSVNWSSDNKILTTSHDRDAKVWVFENGQWEPELVILNKQKRSITCGAWSPHGNKFATGSASNLVHVSYKGEKWW